MSAKKTNNSDVHADLKRRVTRPVTTIVEDLDSVRVKPSAAAHLMPPWQRIARRKGNAKHSS
jgi:hypothetical protein